MEYDLIKLIQTIIYPVPQIFIYIFHNINHTTSEYVSYQVIKLINIQEFLSAKPLGRN